MKRNLLIVAAIALLAVVSFATITALKKPAGNVLAKSVYGEAPTMEQLLKANPLPSPAKLRQNGR